MVKRFESTRPAPQKAKGDDDLAPLLFCLPGNDRVLVATVPKRAIWQRAVLASRANVPRDRQAAAIIDFARGVLEDPTDGQHFEDRLMNPADKLDVPDLFQPVTWLSTAWGEQTKDPKAREAAWAEYRAHLEQKQAAAAALVADSPSAREVDAGEEFAIAGSVGGALDEAAGAAEAIIEAQADGGDDDVAVAAAVL